MVTVCNDPQQTQDIACVMESAKNGLEILPPASA
jgi:hypothetical protein